MIARYLPGNARFEADESDGGALTLIRRFGLAANNKDLHCLVLDGVHRRGAYGVGAQRPKVAVRRFGGQLTRARRDRRSIHSRRRPRSHPAAPRAWPGLQRNRPRVRGASAPPGFRGAEMFDWLKRKSAHPAPPPTAVRPAPAPPAPPADPPLEPAPRESKGISYNPDLIRQYHEDHRQLLGLFGRAKQAAEAGQWSEVEATLNTFRTALTDHLLSESVRLYTYLKQQIAGDQDSMDMMKSFSSEMNGIGRVVMSFLDGQKDLSRSPAKQGAFLPVWAEIGRTLGDRIAREEKTLYPMYQDSH